MREPKSHAEARALSASAYWQAISVASVFYERHGARSIGHRVAFWLDREPIFDILYWFS